MYVIFFSFILFIAGLDIAIKARHKKSSTKRPYDSQAMITSHPEHRI